MSEEYNKSWEKFLEEMGEDTPEFEVEFAYAWRTCKEEVLKILKEHSNTDEKTSLDEVFKKIEKL